MTMTLSSIILKDKFALQILIIHIETNEQSFETFFSFVFMAKSEDQVLTKVWRGGSLAPQFKPLPF